MAISRLHPGVCAQEIPSDRAIIAGATLITTSAGRTRGEPENKPEIRNGFTNFERVFGRLRPGTPRTE
jgi:hypothetical protein